ncbi:bifunctional DNA primase/polymerase [Saccharopolyspora mangrovi]|uniref:Bifunctional DNA primase/polymerase n=1 Tax=Saccharopolyspora mangrovi TaxID=3082379 RepID=A0ABU6A7B9_9PSEU|nr:bifunctional DNA primase/polymerase [Saccharopolyspora sp. S2-29]MEB3367384.1 bifunctional DNA primase/polymerase [Saccharopolyspora sp. S2-29]
MTLHYWSTCGTCGEAMKVYKGGEEQLAHPRCEERPNYTQRLLRKFVAAASDSHHDRAGKIAAEIEELDARAPRLLEAALAYAEWDWPVFPCQTGGKTPLTANGFKDATTDPATIRQWWVRWPTANVGLATGHRFDVIDIDRPDGTWSWDALRDSDSVPPIHGVATTQASGTHLYIEPTGDGNLTKVRPGIDYRGIGGYVVAPPSVGEKGAYRWAVRPSPTIKRRKARR